MFLRRFHGDWYDAARLKAMDHHGYITASGDIVLAASSISSSSNDSVLDELAALALIDVGVIDPSDVYIYKGAAEGAIIAASVIANRFFYIFSETTVLKGRLCYGGRKAFYKVLFLFHRRF